MSRNEKQPSRIENPDHAVIAEAERQAMIVRGIEEGVIPPEEGMRAFEDPDYVYEPSDGENGRSGCRGCRQILPEAVWSKLGL